MSSPSVSIGVITLKERTAGLRKLLEHLKPVIQAHDGDIELIIANNSGEQAHETIAACVSDSRFDSSCPVSIIDSPQNNIATGRNILLDHSSHTLLAFLDDDEYPCRQWLHHLLQIRHACQATVVAGPVKAVFHPTAPHWVHTVDLHNSQGRTNAAPIDITGTGNVLIDKTCIGDLRFDENFGLSGGSDTDFFLRVREHGGSIYWASEAIAHEDIAESRSSARYMIHRFIKQGDNYRRISQERGLVGAPLIFQIRALAMVLASLPVAGLLLLMRHPGAGHWMKRAFSNYGKIHSPNKRLYES